MNEYRDKSSQLTAMQTQDSREKSQVGRLSDEEDSLHSEYLDVETKFKTWKNKNILKDKFWKN